MPKTEKFELKTRISEELLAELAIKQADKKVEYNAKKLKLSNIRSQYNKEIIALDEEITELANQVHTKHHVEKLDCPLNPLPASKRMELLHPNTGEVVHTRPMTADEAKEGYLFEGINDPEDSAKNTRAFLEKKGKDDGIDPVDPEWHDTAAELDSHKDTEPESVGEIEADGEHDAHPQCGAGGCYLPKLATRHEVDLTGLDFTAVVRTIQDSRDGCWHSQWAFGSTVKPVFKGESRANDFEPNSLSYDSEGRAIIGASIAMLDAIKAHDKWTKVASGRALDIIGQIERFQGAQVVTVEEVANAVAAD